ncbi:YjbF family lipoprotein [Meridianimarinicoccus sp. RP-17]|uniref:YjbF family lipoprotein n=1 Tax=Meridianimarinicoccus zhengii TaxID=2056810 RepID=UPI000DAC7540|nr:YjbF family lipoprotein [Phycocomes zhengii]
MTRKGTALLLCLLAGCGSTGDVNARRDLFLSGLEALDPRAPEPLTIAEVRSFIPTALERVEGGLVLVEQPDADRAEFFSVAGRNGSIVTYGSDSQTTIALDGPVMVATRGFGDDIMSADVDVLPELLAARQGGSYSRVLRYLDGEDRTTSIRLDCNLRPTDPANSNFIEYCGTAELEFRNVYQVDGGRVVLSVQWHGPLNGYLTINHLR